MNTELKATTSRPEMNTRTLNPIQSGNSALDHIRTGCRGVSQRLADYIIGQMDCTTDTLLDLEIKIHQIPINHSQTGAFACCFGFKREHPLMSARRQAQRNLGTTIQRSIDDAFKQTKRWAKQHPPQHGMLSHNNSAIKALHQQAFAEEMGELLLALKKARILEPIKSRGTTLALIQLKHKVQGGHHFPATRPLETHVECTLPVTPFRSL